MAKAHELRKEQEEGRGLLRDRSAEKDNFGHTIQTPGKTNAQSELRIGRFNETTPFK
jgi:hypothetical protein